MTGHIKLLLLFVSAISLSCINNVKQTDKNSTETATKVEKIQDGKLQEPFNPYFIASGNEPFWNLQIARDFIKLKFIEDSMVVPHTAPIRAMDANVKLYKTKIATGTIDIQISKNECVNTMSGKNSPYSVSILSLNKNSGKQIEYQGCGSYITDHRLHDIWVVEKMNGNMITKADFNKDFPYLEINSANNTFLGFAGCNEMNGQIFSEDKLLRFTNIITTKKLCERHNIEMEFIKALQSSTSYKIENNRLILSNPDRELLIFKKID